MAYSKLDYVKFIILGWGFILLLEMDIKYWENAVVTEYTLSGPVQSEPALLL